MVVSTIIIMEVLKMAIPARFPNWQTEESQLKDNTIA
jgi:hypothetical protein